MINDVSGWKLATIKTFKALNSSNVPRLFNRWVQIELQLLSFVCNISLFSLPPIDKEAADLADHKDQVSCQNRKNR